MTDTRKQYLRKYVNDRGKKCYPPPKIVGLIEAYATLNNVTESAVISHAVKCFFDNMPAIERLKLNC